MLNVLAILGMIAGVGIGASLCAWWLMIRMPGRSFRGNLPPLSEHESEVCRELQDDLTVLADDIGERNVSQRYGQLVEAAVFIERSLQKAGYETRRQEFSVDEHVVWNVDAERTGCRHPEEIVVVGAHYDTVPGSPGANDNGSAVVANSGRESTDSTMGSCAVTWAPMSVS